MSADQTKNDFTTKPLYKLLARSFPEMALNGSWLDVRGFANAVGMSAEGVYKWLRADRLSPDGARKVLDLAKKSDVALTQEDLIRFVLR